MGKRIFLILVLAVLLLAAPMDALAQDGAGPPQVGLRPDAPPYALHGPYWVGAMDLVIEDEARPLPLTVWYPAQEGVEEITYVHDLEFVTLPPVEQPGHAIRDGEADPSGAPYPLVIFSHGNQWYRQSLVYLAEHLASHGFVVMAADHVGNTLAYGIEPTLRGAGDAGYIKSILDSVAQRPADIQREIDFARQVTAGDDALSGMIDTERIAVLGHSHGGYAALAAAGACVDMTPVIDWCDSVAGDPAAVASFGYTFLCTILAHSEAALRASLGFDVGIGGLWPSFGVEGVDAIVPMAPGAAFVSAPESLADVTVPVLMLASGSDQTAVFDLHVGPVYENLPGPDKTLVVFEGADHFLFAASTFPSWLCEACPQCCSDPMWDMDAAHDLINHFVTAFLLNELYGDEDAAAALAPDAVQFADVRYETTAY